MIAYVDTPPSVEPHKGVFLLTAKSGDETVQIALTRYALRALQRQCAAADAMREIADLGFEITPFGRKNLGGAEQPTLS